MIGRHASILLTQMLTALALMFTLEAHAWINTGHGFHPLAAGVLVTVFLAAPHLMARIWEHDTSN